MSAEGFFETPTWTYKLDVPTKGTKKHEMWVIAGSDDAALMFVEEAYGKKVAERTVIVSKESND